MYRLLWCYRCFMALMYLLVSVSGNYPDMIWAYFVWRMMCPVLHSLAVVAFAFISVAALLCYANRLSASICPHVLHCQQHTAAMNLA